MDDDQLSNTCIEDIENLIPMVESSFGFKFNLGELEQITTFGEFCDITTSKIHLTDAPDCTPQQAFYKLRQALAPHIPGLAVTPASRLEDILPSSRHKRRIILYSVEVKLGFTLSLIGIYIPSFIIIFCAFFLSFASFIVNWHVGIICVSLTCTAMYFNIEFGNTLYAKIIREIVEKMTREHYIQSRRNSNTINRAEIFKQTQALFASELYLKTSALTHDAPFV